MYAHTMAQNAIGRKKNELIKMNFGSFRLISKVRILHLLLNIAF